MFDECGTWVTVQVIKKSWERRFCVAVHCHKHGHGCYVNTQEVTNSAGESTLPSQAVPPPSQGRTREWEAERRRPSSRIAGFAQFKREEKYNEILQV